MDYGLRIVNWTIVCQVKYELELLKNKFVSVQDRWEFVHFDEIERLNSQKIQKNFRIDVTEKIFFPIKQSHIEPKMKPVIKRVRYGALPRIPDFVRSNFSTYFRNKTFAWIYCWKSKNFNFSKPITSFRYFGAATKKKKKDHAWPKQRRNRA